MDGCIQAVDKLVAGFCGENIAFMSGASSRYESRLKGFEVHVGSTGNTGESLQSIKRSLYKLVGVLWYCSSSSCDWDESRWSIWALTTRRMVLRSQEISADTISMTILCSYN